MPATLLLQISIPGILHLNQSVRVDSISKPYITWYINITSGRSSVQGKNVDQQRKDLKRISQRCPNTVHQY